ncbi:hypothetical protein ACFVHW_11450 [Streptomyces sp. NPDC127110]|uniref:hypothetical protein n=1 Tax=Streptomyces sp. NPDC127110 TaxID=3345362 RepID=UPI00363943F7
MGRMKPGRTRRTRWECERCGTRAPGDWTSAAAEHWSGRYEGGRLALIVCPPYHSPVEVEVEVEVAVAEAELNAAAVTVGKDTGSRFAADPLVCLTGTWAEPRTVLYGRDPLDRIVLDGPVDWLGVVEELLAGTRCAHGRRRDDVPAQGLRRG